MKKITIAVLCLTLLICSCLPISAQETNHVLVIGKVEYIFDDMLTYGEQLQLIDAINHCDDGIATCGLMCTLFGHKYEEKSVTTVTHGVSSSQPTCLEEHFLVGQCTRCDASYVDRTAAVYVYCECGM